MKKNKKHLPLLLLALLLISISAYGTRAYFTDSETINRSVTIKYGTLSLNSSYSDWTNISPSSETMINGGTITNAKVSDEFQSSVTLTNDGSLKAAIQVDFSKFLEGLGDNYSVWVTCKLNGTTKVDNYQLTVNDKAYSPFKFKMDTEDTWVATFTLKPNMDNSGETNEWQDKEVKALQNSLIITATDTSKE